LQTYHLKWKREFLAKSIFYGLIIIALLWVVVPFLWLVVSSLKPASDIMRTEIRWIPKRITIDNYLWTFGIEKAGTPSAHGQTLNILVYLRNTLIIVLVTCVISIMFSLLGGYSLARFRFVGRTSIALSLLATQFFPVILILIPWYILMGKFHLIDSLWGLILTFSAVTVPFSTWMMRGFISTISPDLEECAMTDGCGRIGAFFRITVPLTLPGLVAVMLWICVIVWNAFLIPLVLCNTPRTKTVSVALSELIVFHGPANWGGIMAASVITSLFPMIIFMFIQKYMIGGMTVGAVKG